MSQGLATEDSVTAEVELPPLAYPRVSEAHQMLAELELGAEEGVGIELAVLVVVAGPEEE